MKNLTFINAVLPVLFLLQGSGLFSQNVSSSCDTVQLLSGVSFGATIYQVQNDTFFHFDCGQSRAINSYTLISDISSIHYKDGRLVVYSISPGDSSMIDLVEMFSGEKYRGLIYQSTNESVTLVLYSHETIYLKRSAIKSILHVKTENLKPRIRESQALKTSYVLSGNNLGLQPGEGYYKNGMLFYNHVGFGLTKHFSVAAGTLPIVIIPDPVIASWASLRVRVPLGELPVKFGAGVFGLYTTDFDFNEFLGYYYGNATIGNPYNNFTLGYGRGGFLQDNDSVIKTFTFGSQLYLAPKLSLLLESLQFTDEDYWLGLNTLCFRLHRKNITADIGAICLTNYGDDVFFVSPWLSCTFPFGKK